MQSYIGCNPSLQSLAMRFYSVFVALFFFTACTDHLPSSPPAGPEETPGPVLIVSPSHVRDLEPIRESMISGKESIDRSFRQLVSSGDLFCSMKSGKMGTDLELASHMIRREVVSDYLRAGRGDVKSLVAGCWNFIEMNDFRPDLDFHLVKHLFPKKRFSCYSVGFLQPYIMHSILGCDNLTMVDIDWRILDAHRQFIEARERGLSPLQSVGQVRTGWIAFRKPYGPELKLDLSLVCRHIQKDQCRQMIGMIDGSTVPENWRLNLSALHDVSFYEDRKSTPVFFLSNAIEEMYTSPSQFKTLMERTASHLDPGGKALFIHHVGGWKLFGIYELESGGEGKGYSIRTLCKDRYLAMSRGKEGKPAVYETYFEKATKSTGTPPTCSSLVSNMDQKK